MQKLKIYTLIIDDDKDTVEDIVYAFKEAHMGRLCEYEAFTEIDKFVAKLPEANIAIVDHHLSNNATGFGIIDKISEENKKRASIVKIKVIIISGTTDVNVPAVYMNQRKARFYVNKNKRLRFLEELIQFTQVCIEEVKEDMRAEERLRNTENWIDKIVSVQGLDGQLKTEENHEAAKK